jgi:hypothetical protein
MREVYAETGEMTTGGGKERKTIRKETEYRGVACL